MVDCKIRGLRGKSDYPKNAVAESECKALKILQFWSTISTNNVFFVSVPPKMQTIKEKEIYCLSMKVCTV